MKVIEIITGIGFVLLGCTIMYFTVGAIKTYVAPKAGDFALTDRQVLDKAQLCHKEGMAIQLVYDENWQVYAVKCVYGGFTGDGRKKGESK
jgi:hypothetical protein